jgi:hypothetical protein
VRINRRVVLRRPIDRRFTAPVRDACCYSLQAIKPTRAKHDLRTALGQQQRSGLTYSAACARNRNDLIFNSRH